MAILGQFLTGGDRSARHLRSPASSSAYFTHALRVPQATPSSRAICAIGRPEARPGAPLLPGIPVDHGGLPFGIVTLFLSLLPLSLRASTKSGQDQPASSRLRL